MRKRKVYMSVPMTLDWSSVQLFKRRFPEREFQVTLWDRNQFFPEYFKEAKEVVFFLPRWGFTHVIEDLPIGVKRELKEAVREGKKIYLGYITNSGEYNIYEAEIVNGVVIAGKKGTANTIFEGTEGATMKTPVDDNLYSAEDSTILDSSGSTWQFSGRKSFDYTLKVSLEEFGSDERLLLML